LPFCLLRLPMTADTCSSTSASEGHTSQGRWLLLPTPSTDGAEHGPQSASSAQPLSKHGLIGPLIRCKSMPKYRKGAGRALGVSMRDEALSLLLRPRLTTQEILILELVAAGLTTREIAARICVSAKDVEYHIGNLILKFAANNRTGVVSRAFILGYLSMSDWPPACSGVP
jgi:DNA-binding CsgD family transcriptional regulator